MSAVPPLAAFEEETAQSLIRKRGFPPYHHYSNAPVVYACPCCANLSPRRRRSRSTVAEEHRKAVLQETIIEDRARARYPEPRVWPHTLQRARRSSCPPPTDRAAGLPPPPGIADVRAMSHKQRHRSSGAPVLQVLVHRGSQFEVPARTPVTVQARLGRYVGETRPLPMRKKSLKWGEQFALPISAENTQPLEIRLVTNGDETPKCVGVVTIAHLRLFDAREGKKMHVSIAGGKLILSWKVSEARKDVAEATVHTEAEAPPYVSTHAAVFIRSVGIGPRLPESTSTVEFVLRDANGSCTPPVTIPWDKERHAHDCSTVPTLTLRTTTRMITLLCVRRQEHQDNAIVVASAILDTSSLPPNSSAKISLSAYPNGSPVGHVVLEWLLSSATPHPPPLCKADEALADEARAAPNSDEALDLANATLSVTIIRGISLVDVQGSPLPCPSLSVACGELQADIPAMLREGSDVLWNQEVRFASTKSNVVECVVGHGGHDVASGSVAVHEVRGIRMVVVRGHDRDGRPVDCGHVLLKYRLSRDAERCLSPAQQQRESPMHGSAEGTPLSSARTGPRRWPPAIETSVSPTSNPASPRSVRSREVSPPLSSRSLSPPRIAASVSERPRFPAAMHGQDPLMQSAPSKAQVMNWSLGGSPKGLLPPAEPSSSSPQSRPKPHGTGSARHAPAQNLLSLLASDSALDRPDDLADSAPVPRRRLSTDSALAASVSELRESRRWRLPAKEADTPPKQQATDANASVSASPRDPFNPKARRWSLRDGNSSTSRDRWNDSVRIDPGASQTSRGPERQMHESIVEKGEHEKPPRIFFKAAPGGQIAFFREGDPIPPNMPAASDSLYGKVPSAWTDLDGSLSKAAEAEQRARDMLKEQLHITSACVARRSSKYAHTAPWFPPGSSMLDTHYPHELKLLTKVTANTVRVMSAVVANVRSRSQVPCGQPTAPLAA